MYESREDMVRAEAEAAGYEGYVLPGYGKPSNWYNHNEFLFGDYVGSYRQQANIEAVKEWMSYKPERMETLNPDYEQDTLNALQSCLVIVLRLGYRSEQVIFNMPKLSEEYPEFYDELIGIDNYPILDEELMDEIAEQRIKTSWKFCVDDILKEVYEASPDKQIANFDVWKKLVIDTYTEDGLLDIFRGYSGGDSWDDYTDQFIEHETGRDVYFQCVNHKGEYTTPMLRLINMTKLYTEAEGAKIMAQNPETAPA